MNYEQKAEQYGKGYIDALVESGEVEQFLDLDYMDFFRAMINANSPAFVPTDEDGEPLPGLDDDDDELFATAVSAAYDALQSIKRKTA